MTSTRLQRHIPDMKAYKDRRGILWAYCDYCLAWHKFGKEYGEVPVKCMMKDSPYKKVVLTWTRIRFSNKVRHGEKHLIEVMQTMSEIVYFIQAGEKGPVKIGYTGKDNVGFRLSDLQVGNHEKLRLIGFVYGDRDDERRLQRHFRKLHIRGEWFKPHKVLTRYVLHNTIRASQNGR